MSKIENVLPFEAGCLFLLSEHSFPHLILKVKEDGDTLQSTSEKSVVTLFIYFASGEIKILKIGLDVKHPFV